MASKGTSKAVAPQPKVSSEDSGSDRDVRSSKEGPSQPRTPSKQLSKREEAGAAGAAEAQQAPVSKQQQSTGGAKKSSSKKKQKDRKRDKGSSSSSDSSSSGSEAKLPAKYKSNGWRYPGLQATASYRQLNTMGGCHQYTISGYQLARSLGCGTRLCSDYFEAGGQLFRIEAYPSGVSADTRRHLSLFLTTPGACAPNHVLHEVAILDQSGRARHVARASRPKDAPLFAGYRGVIAGYPEFVKASVLEAHPTRYLVNDTLVIRATVEVVRSWSTQPHASQPGMPVMMPHMLGTNTAHMGANAPPHTAPVGLNHRPVAPSGYPFSQQHPMGPTMKQSMSPAPQEYTPYPGTPTYQQQHQLQHEVHQQQQAFLAPQQVQQQAHQQGQAAEPHQQYSQQPCTCCCHVHACSAMSAPSAPAGTAGVPSAPATPTAAGTAAAAAAGTQQIASGLFMASPSLGSCSAPGSPCSPAAASAAAQAATPAQYPAINGHMPSLLAGAAAAGSPAQASLSSVAAPVDMRGSVGVPLVPYHPCHVMMTS